MKVLDFDFPEGLYYMVEHQVWARLNSDASASVGITSLGIAQAGDIYMCRPKSVGSEVGQARSIAVIELAKAIVSVKCPVRGMVIEINERLAAEPELVHLDPYRAGWLARLRLADFDADRGLLVQGEAVREAMRQHAWLNGMS